MVGSLVAGVAVFGGGFGLPSSGVVSGGMFDVRCGQGV